MALRVRLPEAAVGREVFEEGPHAVAALARRVHAHGRDAVGADVALEPLAVHGELRGGGTKGVHAVILGHRRTEKYG
jgi:hypothetical protein